MDSAELKELLKGTTAFSILSDEELNCLSERLQLVHYTLGQAIVRAGEESDAFYVVYSGRARVIAIPRRARRYPALLQLSETDCGAACLSMILRYYGKHVSINRIRDLANVGREGSTRSIAFRRLPRL